MRSAGSMRPFAIAFGVFRARGRSTPASSCCHSYVYNVGTPRLPCPGDPSFCDGESKRKHKRKNKKKKNKKPPRAVTILPDMDAQPSTQEDDAPRPEAEVRGVELASALQSHDRLLRSAVQSRLGENQAVDEVMQEVALAAVRHAERSVAPANMGGWLYRVAVRCVLLYRRSRGRQVRLHERYINVQGRASEAPAGPLECLMRTERESIVQKALASLPEPDREILAGKYTEGLSYRELAARLGIGETAVEARLHRARQRLREVIVRLSADEETRP